MNPYYEPYWIKDDKLEHYGVLGMRWGIRRYQPYPKGKHGKFLGQSRDEDIRIKKGTEAYRLQSGDALTRGQTYVSFDKVDHLRYIGATSAGEGGLTIDMYNTDDSGKLAGNPKSVRMKLTEDIIAPSYQTTMDAFIETMDHVKMDDIVSNPKAWERESVKKFLKNVKNIKVDECRDEAYIYFTSKFMKDSKAKEMFFNNLKSKGYNAIIDENDKRFGNSFTEAPIILFDSKSVKVSEAKDISKEEADMFSSFFWGGGKDFGSTQKKWEKWANTKLDKMYS